MRCGLIVNLPAAPSATSLSPPRPMVRTSMARTMVRQPPTSAPSSFTRGRPLSKTPKSVVVPPMSDMMKLCKPESHWAPTRLAAGPESTVSIGRVATLCASARLPSPFTIISGQAMPSCAIARPTASISPDTRAIKRALSVAVRARRGASKEEDSSVDRVTGLPVSATIRSRACNSCAALRTAKAEATAMASTLGAMATKAARRASVSKGMRASPLWSWPPSITARAMPGKALAMPVRSTMAASKPISTTPTALPWPSTTALVAKVVETETNEMSLAASPWGNLAMASVMAPVTPIDRSPLVVMDLAEATTLWPWASMMAASV